MSLKDKLEKIIRSEREKLKNRDQKRLENEKERYERECERFRLMHTLLEEFVAAIDPKYMEATIGENRAFIEVGQMRECDEYLEEEGGEYLDAAFRWYILPDYEIKWGVRDGESLFEEKAGVRVEEWRYQSPEDNRWDSIYSWEEIYNFTTEEEALEDIVQKAAEVVAHYQHLDKKSELSSNPPDASDD